MILTDRVQYFRMITALLLLTGIAGAAPVEEWNRTYNVGRIYDVQETQDEGYILAAGDALVKTDAYGNEQWSKTFDENIEKSYPVRGGAKSVQQTSDSGYILAESLGLENSDYVRVIKFYSVGKIGWIRKFEKTCGEGSSVLQTLDGGYLLATCNNTGNYYNTVDALLIKLDAKGNELWNRNFGETNSDDGFYSVQKTQDGGYILAGYDVPLFYGSNVWLVKISEEPEGAAMPKKTPAFEALLFFITLAAVYIRGLWRGK